MIKERPVTPRIKRKKEPIDISKEATPFELFGKSVRRHFKKTN